jgi:hypothetical protein
MQSFIKIADALLEVAVEDMRNLSLYRTFLYLINNLSQLRGVKISQQTTKILPRDREKP